MTIIAIDECYDATKFPSIKALVSFANRNGYKVDPNDHIQVEERTELTAGLASKLLKGYALYLRGDDDTEWTYKVQRV